MNWKEIKVSDDKTHFILNGTNPFQKVFKEVMKFHEPGLAPVLDGSGWYHINANGQALYPERYKRTFGFYYNRAAIQRNDGYFHIDEKGNPLNGEVYKWCGNYQEDVCVVRGHEGSCFYIDLQGNRLGDDTYIYAGDYKDGYACVKTVRGWTHVNKIGTPLHGCYFLDLGVYHKGFATARDGSGWFHIDRQGLQIYVERYLQIEPFYNGVALVHDFNWNIHLIDEKGKVI